MKIKCIHGYFIFEETKSGQVSDFISLFGDVSIVSKDHYFTFETLKDAPRYSISGGLYLGAPATKTFEGNPWDVMRENDLVYDFINDLVVPILSITTQVSIQQASKYFIAAGMMMPGSITDDGSRVTDYSAFYLPDSLKFKYSEVGLE